MILSELEVARLKVADWSSSDGQPQWSICAAGVMAPSEHKAAVFRASSLIPSRVKWLPTPTVAIDNYINSLEPEWTMEWPNPRSSPTTYGADSIGTLGALLPFAIACLVKKSSDHTFESFHPTIETLGLSVQTVRDSAMAIAPGAFPFAPEEGSLIGDWRDSLKLK